MWYCVTLPCLCLVVHEGLPSLRLRGTTFEQSTLYTQGGRRPHLAPPLYCPGPTPGVNQVGCLTTADPDVLGVSQDGARELAAGLLNLLARPAGLLAAPRPVPIGWHWHHAGRLAWLRCVDLLLPKRLRPLSPFCRNSLVCHNQAWRGRSPTPLDHLERLPQRQWVGP